MCACLQVVFEPQTQPEASKLGARLRSEWVVCVKGQLRLRKDPNPKMPTGGEDQQQQQLLLMGSGSSGSVAALAGMMINVTGND